MDSAAALEAKSLLGDGTSGVRDVVAQGRSVRLYFERQAPPLRRVVFGATQVAMPQVEHAAVLGLRTGVVFGRERFATRARFPRADEVLVGMPSELAGAMALGRQSLVVLLAHDYKYDLPVLQAVLESEAGYVGVLGSRRRGRALLDFLAESGVPAEQLARVRVPVGLDIGARSAEEIALSVLAEALAVARGRDGGSLRDRPPPT
jgi:xanthine dehydrogenase accessory factor